MSRLRLDRDRMAGGDAVKQTPARCGRRRRGATPTRPPGALRADESPADPREQATRRDPGAVPRGVPGLPRARLRRHQSRRQRPRTPQAGRATQTSPHMAYEFVSGARQFWCPPREVRRPQGSGRRRAGTARSRERAPSWPCLAAHVGQLPPGSGRPGLPHTGASPRAPKPGAEPVMAVTCLDGTSRTELYRFASTPLNEVAFPARETAVWYARRWEIESMEGPRRDVVTSQRCADRSCTHAARSRRSTPADDTRLKSFPG